MNPNAVLKFLQSLRSLAKSGVIKSVDEAFDFAKREFGEINDLFKRQIEQVFKRPVEKTPKPGEGGITSIKNAPKKETPDQESGISFSIPEKGIFRQKGSIDEITKMITKPETTPLMSRLEKGAETLKQMKQPGMDLTTGMARTAARVILDNAGIKVPEKVDPLEVIAKEFGGDVLMDLKDVAEELIEKERTGKITESMGEFLESRGMFNLQRGRTDAPKGMSDEELEQIKKQVDQEKQLKDFDPTDRTENSEGGINRVAYRYGSGKSLIKFLKGKNNLIKKIKQAVDDIFPTGDSKYDADVAVDTMFEELGVDRDMFDQKEVLDAYGLAYDELKKPLLEKIKNKPGSKPIKQGDPITSENFGESQFAPDTSDLEKAKILDDVDEAYGMAPKMVERFQLKERFPGIDDNLLTQIIDDPDPQNKAEAISTLDQAMELMKQGKDPDEVISILENIKKSRRDNSKGGLQYLMGM